MIIWVIEVLRRIISGDIDWYFGNLSRHASQSQVNCGSSVGDINVAGYLPNGPFAATSYMVQNPPC